VTVQVDGRGRRGGRIAVDTTLLVLNFLRFSNNIGKAKIDLLFLYSSVKHPSN